jgi:hypothetical protein
MNRKHQGQSGRQNMQLHPRGSRQNQNQNQFDMDQDYEGMQMGPRSRNFSGNSSWSADDSALDNVRTSSQSYRDTDYDLDGSTYGSQGRSPRGMDRNFGGRLGTSEYGSSYGSMNSDYDTNRSPSRYDRDEERFTSSNRGSSFGSDRMNADRFSSDRQASSNERFGYPSSMNAWSGSDRSYNSGRTAGRMGQSSFSPQDQDLSNPHSYGATGPSSLGSFGEEGSLHQNWGSQSSQRGFLGKGPKGYKRSDDRIKEDVCETLSRDPRVDASEIEVNVDDAMVTLSGTVDNREAKRTAEMIIENLSGVDDVKNEIKVKKAGETGSDTLQASSSNSNRPTTSMGSSSTKSSSTKSSSQM